MKKIVVLFFILIVGSVGIYSQDSAKTNNYSPVHKFDPIRDPEKDLNAAIQEAKKTDKRILLDVGGDWCIWCHKLDDFFEMNKDVKQFINDNYILLKINYSKENTNEKFLSKFPKIPGYPHFFVLDSDGKFLHSQGTGMLEKDGAHDREKVLTFLEKWAHNRKNK